MTDLLARRHTLDLTKPMQEFSEPANSLMKHTMVWCGTHDCYEIVPYSVAVLRACSQPLTITDITLAGSA